MLQIVPTAFMNIIMKAVGNFSATRIIVVSC